MKAILCFSLAVSGICSGHALAETKNSAKQHTTKDSITEAEAQTIALKIIQGKVVEVEREKHLGQEVYSIEIRASDGVHEVILSASDGSLLNKPSSVNKDEFEDGDDE